MSKPQSATDSRKRDLFLKALELQNPQERAAFLDGACGTDAELRAAVEVLLRSHQDDSFLEHPAALVDPGPAFATAPITEKPGDAIGRYKLLEKLGEGGFGVVYMAEQREPVKRRVALKIIKVGMDTREVVARFEAERQALALMDHPNIAKVLDGGATETGRPYFVMELVRGIKITEYCDQNQLGLEERLKLFMQVCHAVQHAHQKGIIHRDLKPSNILVTLHDGVPVPKVIDFGIAKATQQELTEKTLFTQFHQFIGTPSYMSPEQAELSGLDIDTRSDIYSLGVLLYELLAGKPPFDGQELLKAGLDEMRRTLREVEPPPPSTRLKQARSGTHSAASDKSAIRNPQSAIDADLDWIVMKCLEKDRTRRYETASGLAADIQRHLSNEPVSARPPSKAYRFQKLVRRNKLTFGAAASVLAALLIGLATSLWQYAEKSAAYRKIVAAEREQSRLRQKAEIEASKSEQIAGFLQDMLKGVSPSVALGRDTTLLREILDKTAERLDKDLKGQPEVEAHLRYTLGEVYRALALPKEAEAMHRAGLAIVERELGGTNIYAADAHNGLGLALHKSGKLAEAETELRTALAMTLQLEGEHGSNVTIQLNNLSHVLLYQNRLAEAEALQRRALELLNQPGEAKDARAGVWLSNLGIILGHQGNFEEAEKMHRNALTVLRERVGNERPHVAVTLNSLAELLRERGRLAEAEATQQEALGLLRKLHPVEHTDLARSIYTLGTLQQLQRKLPEAEATYCEALLMQRKLLGEDDPGAAQILNDLATTIRKQGRLTEAKEMYEDALRRLRRNTNSLPRYVSFSLAGLAEVFQDQGKLGDAEALQREVLERRRQEHGNEHIGVAASQNDLASVLRDQGKHIEAEKMFAEAMAIQRKLLGNDHPHLATSLDNCAASLNARGQSAEAEAMYREALAIRRKMLRPDHPDLVTTVSRLGGLLFQQGKFADAEPLYREFLAGRRQLRDEDHEDVLSASVGLAHLLTEWAWAESLTRSATQTANPELVARAREAESLLRATLAIREARTNASRGLVGATQSRLGIAVLVIAIIDPTLDSSGRAARCLEAEGHLLSGQEKMERSRAATRKAKRDGLERLVRLYEAWDQLAPKTGKAEKAAEWKQKLASFDQATTTTKSDGAEP